MQTLKKVICAKLGIDWTSAPLSYSQTFRAAKTSGSTTGVNSYTTPARGSFKHRETSRRCFWRKLSGCVKNITAFCQHLLRPIKSAVLADTDISVKPKYRPIYRSISNVNTMKPHFFKDNACNGHQSTVSSWWHWCYSTGLLVNTRQ